MGRSLKKGPYVDPRLFAKVMKATDANVHAMIRTWCRRCTIPPEFVGRTFEVHNGKSFIKVFVTEDMVGHKLGEFSPTRVWKGHGGGRKK